MHYFKSTDHIKEAVTKIISDVVNKSGVIPIKETMSEKAVHVPHIIPKKEPKPKVQKSPEKPAISLAYSKLPEHRKNIFLLN